VHRATWVRSRCSCHHTFLAIDTEVLLVHPADLSGESLRQVRSEGRLPGLDRVIARWSDLQRPADRLDPEFLTVRIHDPAHLLGCGSSSRATKAEAAFKISFALRSSLLSRSSSLIRCASALVMPGRSPSSTSALRTHLRSVSEPTPNFSAIEVIAAHSVGYSRRCSNTSRPARSHTSAGYLWLPPWLACKVLWRP
jgi:hypothetical protein